MPRLDQLLNGMPHHRLTSLEKAKGYSFFGKTATDRYGSDVVVVRIPILTRYPSIRAKFWKEIEAGIHEPGAYLRRLTDKCDMLIALLLQHSKKYRLSHRYVWVSQITGQE